ncbi:MAG TPA: MauE/DoxX family redox-associated membrane protein [Solirubrobacteraceae bacterium]|jgi:hypothetical protein|nr:MauE/DoxX family redox-associated membrane protein [Solirubrobacteraceae bacterium]
MGAPGTEVVLLLALVLVWAAIAKLLESIRPLPIGELAVAAVAVLAPGRVGAAALAAVFTGFTAFHIRQWRMGQADCECFGEHAGVGASPGRRGAMTALSAGAALLVAVAGAPSLAALSSGDPGAVPAVVLAAVCGAAAWRLAFTIRLASADGMADALVRDSALMLERRLSRRTLLQRTALVGSALAVTPVRYLLYPGTAMAAIAPDDCAGGQCTDGYTAFCCQINHGRNSCPEGTYAGGWWMCTDYAGRLLCADQGARYYVDCNALPGTEFPGGCQCAGGSCENQRVACNIFRYGQCNTQVPGITAVVCRMVVCENPSTIRGLNCGSSLAVDDAVCGQDTPCLAEARQLAGAGGV